MVNVAVINFFANGFVLVRVDFWVFDRTIFVDTNVRSLSNALH